MFITILIINVKFVKHILQHLTRFMIRAVFNRGSITFLNPVYTWFHSNFESALREVREAVDNAPIDVRDINMKWIEQDQSELPEKHTES